MPRMPSPAGAGRTLAAVRWRGPNGPEQRLRQAAVMRASNAKRAARRAIKQTADAISPIASADQENQEDRGVTAPSPRR